jgi:hypothetical protein
MKDGPYGKEDGCQGKPPFNLPDLQAGTPIWRKKTGSFVPLE